MNCIDADCKYVYCKYEKGPTEFTDIVNVYCKLGQKPSYPFIDDGKTNMLCPLFECGRDDENVLDSAIR